MDEEKKECPICGGTFWVEKGDGVVRCSCYKEYLKKKRIEEAQIPSAYKNKKLENYKPLTNSQGRALKISNEFVKEFLNGKMDRGLLFMGKTGVGKTHLAIGILNALLDEGFRGYFINFIHLIEKIKSSYNPLSQSAFSEPEFFNRIKRSHIIVIDELGAQTPTEFAFNKMYDIINYCFSEGISIIFTTNYYLMDEKRKNPTDIKLDSTSYISKLHKYYLEERISDRLVSRILGKCIKVEIEGIDYRRKFNVY